MIRKFVYPGSIPQDTDILSLYNAARVADAWVTTLICGYGNSVVSGLACTGTGTMYLNFGAGVMAQLLDVDPTAYGSLGTNINQVMVSAFTVAGAALLLTAPTTAGDSINYLIEAQIESIDGTPLVLPYVNAANPANPYSGPANSGTPNNTTRADEIALQSIAGAQATTGAQTTPAVTSGWVPLFIVTVPYGATTTNACTIVAHPSAPFVQTPLQQVQTGFSNQVIYSSGSGTWTVPAGVYKIRGTATGGGGGGGGGGGSTGATYIGGGGAGGGFVRAYFAVTPGASYSYGIGGGGAAGSSGGSTTLFGLLTATGGNAGLAGSGSAVGAGATTGGSGGASGQIGSADSHSGNTGQAGIAAGSTALGGSGGGAEGRAIGTTNPSYSISGSGAGLGGFGWGDGASGGVGTGAGGAGAGGRLIIEW